MGNYDYDYDYTKIKTGDYNYDYDYTKFGKADYDYDYDYSNHCNRLQMITITIVIDPMPGWETSLSTTWSGPYGCWVSWETSPSTTGRSLWVLG